MTSATVIIESQPPHIGQYLAVRDVMKRYDNVILCIIDKPMVMLTNKVIAIWTLIFEDYDFSIVSVDAEQNI